MLDPLSAATHALTDDAHIVGSFRARPRHARTAQTLSTVARRLASFVTLALVATACGPTYGMDTAGHTVALDGRTRAVRRQAARDFFCPEEQVGVDMVTSPTEHFRAVGCGRAAEYQDQPGRGLQRSTEITQTGLAPRRQRH